VKIRRHKRPEEASFDLTPMIDVVMLLIVFFTLTAQFSRTEQAIVELPNQPGKAGEHEAKSAMIVDVAQNGAITSLGQPLTIEDLLDQVQELKAKRAIVASGGVATPKGEIEILVRADRACASAHINKIAVALSGAGVTSWKLATNPESSGPTRGPGAAGAESGGGGT
jgi:biopolymer transport protein ExbD